MSEQTFSQRRCKDSRKPSMSECIEVAFYRCPCCHTIYQHMGTSLENKKLSCCGMELCRLEANKNPNSHKIFSIDYKITGGYNDNAVQVFWTAENSTEKPEWIFLKTFTGGYMKYIFDKKRQPMVFALADMDAFAYCDKDPCLECTFRCKRGFVIYVYSDQAGLIEVRLDRMSPYWQS